MEEFIASVFGMIFVGIISLFMLTTAILAFLTPFFIFRIRNEIIKISGMLLKEDEKL